MHAVLKQSKRFPTIAQALAEIERLEKALSELTDRAVGAEARIAELEAMLSNLKRSHYGQKSERKHPPPPLGSLGEISSNLDTDAKSMPAMSRAARKAANDDTAKDERRKKTQSKAPRE